MECVSVCLFVCLFSRGSAAANTLSQLYICSFLFAYICWKKLHVKTWGGNRTFTSLWLCLMNVTHWNRLVCVGMNRPLSLPTGWTTEALQEWGSYMKLAIPSTLMLCFEWWIYELGGFLAGTFQLLRLTPMNQWTVTFQRPKQPYLCNIHLCILPPLSFLLSFSGMLSEVDLAAQHVVIMLAFINYMVLCTELLYTPTLTVLSWKPNKTQCPGYPVQISWRITQNSRLQIKVKFEAKTHINFVWGMVRLRQQDVYEVSS